MFSLDGQHLTINLPDLTNISGITWLWIGLFVSVGYGLITHFCSFKSISEYNKKVEKTLQLQGRECNLKPLDDTDVVFLFIYRVLAGLPVRLISAVGGIIGFVFVLVATGKFRSNCWLHFSRRWYTNDSF